MKRTTASGFAVGNLYTEGDPGIPVPATIVGSIEMNNIQQELSNIVEKAGLTVDQGGTTFDQCHDAMVLYSQGVSTDLQDDFTIANNEAGPTDVTGLIVDKATYVGAIYSIDLYRSTAAPTELQELGFLFLKYDSVNDTWGIELQTFFEDAGVTFTVVAGTGQVQYSSTNIAGATYSGTLRFSPVRLIRATALAVATT